MNRLVIICFIFCLLSSSNAQTSVISERIFTDTVKVNIGDLQINLVKYASAQPNINFLVVHDNEDTGLEAALAFIEKNGGSVIDSQYGNVRNFKFCCNDTAFEADPNAIYTRPGIFAGLNKYSTWKQEAGKQLEALAKQVLTFYKPEVNGYIFTLHNNLDSGFCVDSYLAGNELEHTADSVYVNPNMDPDDMVFVTRTAHFNYLKQKDVNVVLQSIDAPNDGSLSVYAMYMDIPYINIEVQHGHKEEQLRLIELAAGMLSPNPEIIGR